MATSEPEVSMIRMTRREELADRYKRRDYWTDNRGMRITNSPIDLIEYIEALKEQVAKDEKAKTAAYDKYMKAQRDYHASQEAVSKSRDMLDVHKLALADAVQIPR